MVDRPRFFLDENMETAVAAGAARRGVTVITARDAGRLGSNDDAQLAFARETGLVFVTHDRGFERRHWEGESHCGILYMPKDLPIGQMVEWLQIASELIAADEFVGAFITAG